MVRYIASKEWCDERNAWEQISIWQLAEYLFATKSYTTEETIEFIRGLVEQENCRWNEGELRKVLGPIEQTRI